MNKKAAGLIIAGIVILAVYKCPVKLFTGFPCPGCGMTRALIMMFYDIKGAFFMHPLFPAVILFMPALFMKRYREFLLAHYNYIADIMIFLFTAVYIWRMLVVFPDAPMEYNEKNLLKMLFEILGRNL